jgi:hypothetical protein
MQRKLENQCVPTPIWCIEFQIPMHLQFCVSNITWKNRVTLLFCSCTITIDLNKGSIIKLQFNFLYLKCFFSMHFNVFQIAKSSNFRLCICWSVAKICFVLMRVSLFVVGGYGTTPTTSKFLILFSLLKPTFYKGWYIGNWRCVVQHYL